MMQQNWRREYTEYLQIEATETAVFDKYLGQLNYVAIPDTTISEVAQVILCLFPDVMFPTKKFSYLHLVRLILVRSLFIFV